MTACGVTTSPVHSPFKAVSTDRSKSWSFPPLSFSPPKNHHIEPKHHSTRPLRRTQLRILPPRILPSPNSSRPSYLNPNPCPSHNGKPSLYTSPSSRTLHRPLRHRPLAPQQEPHHPPQTRRQDLHSCSSIPLVRKCA